MRFPPWACTGKDKSLATWHVPSAWPPRAHHVAPFLQVVLANPKTAGVARWIFLALWGHRMKKGDAAALDYVTKVAAASCFIFGILRAGAQTSTHEPYSRMHTRTHTHTRARARHMPPSPPVGV